MTKFDIDNNRLFELLEENLAMDKSLLNMDANGGNSILFVYPNDEDALYVAEAKRRFQNNVTFVDVAKSLTDFQEEIGVELFKELEEDFGNGVYYRQIPETGEPANDCFFAFLIERIASAIKIEKPVFLVGTSAFANKGFSNINIMEDKTIKTAPYPLVYFYPATTEGDKIYFLGDPNHVASQYRCRVIR